MLRFRYAFLPAAGAWRVMESPVAPLPRLLLVSDWKALGGRDAIFSFMRDPLFNPAKTILLESKPEPPPQPGAVGSAALMAESPDELTIEAETDRPALLLITDLYPGTGAPSRFRAASSKPTASCRPITSCARCP